MGCARATPSWEQELTIEDAGGVEAGRQLQLDSSREAIYSTERRLAKNSRL
jgi:hypothetical protein